MCVVCTYVYIYAPCWQLCLNIQIWVIQTHTHTPLSSAQSKKSVRHTHTRTHTHITGAWIEDFISLAKWLPMWMHVQTQNHPTEESANRRFIHSQLRCADRNGVDLSPLTDWFDSSGRHTDRTERLAECTAPRHLSRGRIVHGLLQYRAHRLSLCTASNENLMSAAKFLGEAGPSERRRFPR